MTTKYTLSHEQVGHSQDIKCVFTFSNFFKDSPSQDSYFILTGSRDKSVKLWWMYYNNKAQRNREHEHKVWECQLVKIYTFHSHFINALAYIPPNNIYDQGLIASAGSDKIIYVYPPSIETLTSGTSVQNEKELELDTPMYGLVGHEDNICSLFITRQGQIISGSWDRTVRVWEDWKCTKVLKGHTLAVWSVIQLENGHIVSSSADKTIRIWMGDKCIKCITGYHSDVIRQLVPLPFSGFASCSNDCTIRTWKNNGDSLSEYSGHHAYIYTLSPLPEQGQLISAGEDRTIRVWDSTTTHGSCIQTIKVPCHSTWALTTCPNDSKFEGDFIAADSDGVFRIFTRNKDRFASLKLLQEFEDSTHSTTMHSELGDMDLASVKGPETLSQPGEKEGEVRMVKSTTNSDQVQVYQWSVYEKDWKLLGQVVHATGPNSRTKQMYEGREYDYVLSVDVEDGKPPLKLPVNKEDNPYTVANMFIQKWELPLSYLDQIAQFIIQHTSPTTLSGSKDPYHGKQESTMKEPNFISFKSMNKSGVVKKLKEFNQQLNTLTDSDFKNIEEFVDAMANDKISNKGDAVIDKILTMIKDWPMDKIFPVLDLLRLLPFQESYLKTCIQLYPDFLDQLFTKLCQEQDPLVAVKNAKLINRFLVNLYATREGQSLISRECNRVLRIFKVTKNLCNEVETNQAFINNFGLLTGSKPELLVYLDELTR